MPKPEQPGWLATLRPTATPNCLSELQLDALHLKTLPEAEFNMATSHVANCELCRERLALRTLEHEAFAQQFNLGHLAAATLEQVDERRPRRLWQRTLVSVSVLAAAAAVFLFVVSQENFAEFANVRLKGGLTLKVFAKRGADVFQVAPGDPLKPNDALRFEVAPFAAPLNVTHLAILSIDGAQKVSIYAADAGGNALAFEPMWGWLFEGSIVLDDTLGTETLLAVACPTAFAATPLIGPLMRSLQAEPQHRTLAPPQPDCVVEALNFNKVAP